MLGRFSLNNFNLSAVGFIIFLVAGGVFLKYSGLLK